LEEGKKSIELLAEEGLVQVKIGFYVADHDV